MSLDIIIHLEKCNNSLINGTSFNVYEFGQYLNDNSFSCKCYLDDSNIDVDFNLRYTYHYDNKYLSDVSSPVIVLSNSIKIIMIECIQHLINIGLIKFIIIITGNNKMHIDNCIQTIGSSKTYELLNHVIMLYNPLNVNTNDNIDYKYKVEYHNGLYFNHINNETINKTDQWMFHTSEHIFINNINLNNLYNNNYSDILNMFKYCKEHKIKYKIDDIQSLTPYKKFSGLLYCKIIDILPRMPAEFIMHNNNVIVFTYNDGLTYYLDIKKDETYPIIITKDRLIDRKLWCDLEKLEKILCYQ